ncbi:MAG: NAD(+)/NADH kinase [Treponema sp.]|jgi:NAD+ kinase|nr:NAD(+)/NADH kinase [Treponema sp.]
MGKKVVLFVNTHKKNAQDAAGQIQMELEKRGCSVTVYSFEGKPENPPQGVWDIAFSLGGDGTVLYTARCLAPFGAPILPVNMGSLGFIAEVDRDDWLSTYEKWEKGEISASKRCMLEISVERGSEIIMKNICLNDAVISAAGIAKLVNLDVCINRGQGGVPDTSLGSYRCDGLIIATPTGSTAYSMAAGGPILDPEMSAVIINPICPFALSNRPFVLPSQLPLVITVPAQQRTGVLLTIDGQDTCNLQSGDKIYVQQAERPALLIFADRHAYYSALRSKLFWSGDSGNISGNNPLERENA